MEGTKQYVRPERTGWRDAGLSARHRKWGSALYALDLDFVLAEVAYARASALIEYKNERAQRRRLTDWPYRVLVDLGNATSVKPVLGVRYASDFSWFSAVPINDAAKPLLPGASTQAPSIMTEPQYVQFLYDIRGQAMPDGLFPAGMASR